MPEIEAAEPGIVVVADADVWSDGLTSAVRAVTVGAAEWSMPHGKVYRLNPESTLKLLAGEEPVLRPQRRREPAWPLSRRPYEGVLGGGIVIAHRDTFLEIPLDPRFKGPGQEDESWGYAIQTLAGSGWHGKAPLFHLYHEPLPRLSHRRGSKESWDLYRRYAEANMNKAAMRSLIEEFNDGKWTGQSKLHDHSELARGEHR